MSPVRRPFRWIFVAVLLMAGALYLPNLAMWIVSDGESRCTGSTAAGSLRDAVRLTGGRHAQSYCWICSRALRTYGHSDVIAATERAYQLVADEFPDTAWVFGEVGWPWGGSFQPHRTHRNGLSVDFMSPLKDGETMPSHPFNRFGYDERFDRAGVGPAGEIDFDAMAAHLLALIKAARARGIAIRKVIFAPDLQDDLFRARSGSKVKSLIRFNRSPVWVRHDNHYHVDFAVPCR